MDILHSVWLCWAFPCFYISSGTAFSGDLCCAAVLQVNLCPVLCCWCCCGACAAALWPAVCKAGQTARLAVLLCCFALPCCAVLCCCVAGLLLLLNWLWFRLVSFCGFAIRYLCNRLSHRHLEKWPKGVLGRGKAVSGGRGAGGHAQGGPSLYILFEFHTPKHTLDPAFLPHEPTRSGAKSFR